MPALAQVVRLNTGHEIELDGGPETLAFLQAEIRASGLRYSSIAHLAGVCHATVAKLAYGDTKRPQEPTTVAILRALGWRVFARQV